MSKHDKYIIKVNEEYLYTWNAEAHGFNECVAFSPNIEDADSFSSYEHAMLAIEREMLKNAKIVHIIQTIEVINEVDANVLKQLGKPTIPTTKEIGDAFRKAIDICQKGETDIESGI